MLEEDQLIYIDFQKMNIAPVRVSSETPLHLCAKSKCSDPNRFNYGYDGYQYRTVPEQEVDFDVDYSSFN